MDKVASDTFDLSDALRNRLSEINQQKETTQGQINTRSEQLQNLLAKGQKKPRDSLSQLDNRINELETRRTTSSLSLSEEKDILRQIASIKRAKIQLEEFKGHEKNIQDKKNELNELRNVLRGSIAQIAELDGALSKVELAKRLGCSTGELKTHIVDCPGGKLGHVIGKNGANIKQMEKKTGCMVDVDKVKSQVHLHGSEIAIQKAVEHLENITLSVEESFKVSHAVHAFLFSKRMAEFNKISEKHSQTYFDLSKESTTITLRGRPEFVALAKEDILAIDVQKETRKLTGRNTGLVVGKGGVTVNKLVEVFDVIIDVKKESDEVSQMEIVGTANNIERAMKKIDEILFSNEEQEESILVASMTRNKLLSNNGALIKEMRNDMMKQFPGRNVFVSFEKLSKDEMKSASTSLLAVKAPRICILECLEMLKKRVAEYEACVLTMYVDGYLIPKIIGTKGAKIAELRKIGDEVSEIDVQATGEIKIMADKEATRLAIKAAIDEIVAQNQLLKVPTDPSLFGLVFGGPGKELRAELQKNQVSISNDNNDNSITLRGSLEKITEGAVILREYIANNYSIEIKYEGDEEDFLLQGGKESFVNKLQDQFGVKTIVLRSKRIIVFRGKEEKVFEAVSKLNQFVHGGDGISVFKLFAPSNVVGVIIGKKGSNIAKLEKEHEGVSIDVKRSACIFIRGPDEVAQKCRNVILSTIATSKVTSNMTINEGQYDQLVKSNALENFASDVRVHFKLSKSQVQMRGTSKDVNDFEALVEEHLTGIYNASVNIDPSLMEILKPTFDDPSHFERTRNDSKATVQLDSSKCSINLSGKRSQVKKAKSSIITLLTTNIPSQICKMRIAKPLLRSVGDAASIAQIAGCAGCSITLDRDINSLILQSISPDAMLRATNLIDARIKECEKLVNVIELKSWLINYLLANGGAIINQLRAENKSDILVSKTESMVCIKGSDENDVKLTRQKLEDVLTQANKENVFIEVPEKAMNLFMGKSGSQVKALASRHSVKIDRVKKTQSFIHVHGKEAAVASAVSAISIWIHSWEQKNGVAKKPVEAPKVVEHANLGNGKHDIPQDSSSNKAIAPTPVVQKPVTKAEVQKSPMKETAAGNLFNLLVSDDVPDSLNGSNKTAPKVSNGGPYYKSNSGFAVRL